MRYVRTSSKVGERSRTDPWMTSMPAYDRSICWFQVKAVS